MTDGAKYYVLEDNINKGLVIQEVDDMYYTYDSGKNTFIEDDLFMQYITPIGVYTDLFSEIPEFEVDNYIQQYRDAWGKQISISEGYIASMPNPKVRKLSGMMCKSVKELEYKPVAILLPCLLSSSNNKDMSYDLAWAIQMGYNYKTAKMIQSVTDGHLSKNFDTCLNDNIDLFNLLVEFAKKSGIKMLYDCLMNSDMYKSYTSTDTSDLDYLFSEQLRMKELLNS